MTATVPIRRGTARGGGSAGPASVARSGSGPARGGTSRPARADIRAAASAPADTGTPAIVLAFLISLLVPFIIDVGEIALQPHRIVIILTMPYLLIRLLSGKAGKLTSIDFFIFLAAFWCLIAYMLASASFGRSALSAKVQFAFSFFFEMYGGFLIARVGIRNAQDLRRVAKFMFFCLLVALPLAAAEAISHKAFLMELLGRKPAFDVRFGMRRAQVVFGHPILYGTFASTAMGLVWFMYNPQAKLAARVGRAAFVFAALFFSLSMGAILSFVIQSASIAYDQFLKHVPKRWTILLLCVAAVYVLVDIVAQSSPFHVFIRYMTFNHAASYVRILTFQYGVDNVIARPLFGFGSGTWSRPPGFPPSIDNFWLLTAMQFGLPAFLSLATGLGILLRRLSLKALSDPMDIASRSAVLVSMGGIIVAGATVHYWQSMLAFVMFVFGYGVWILSRPDPDVEPEPGQQDATESPAAGAAQQQATARQPAKKRFVPYGREG